MGTVKRYSYGNPIETDAVVKKVAASDDDIKYFNLNEAERSLSYRMTEDTKVFGLGETVRGINKRGWVYNSFNTDETHHEEGKKSLYASENFILVKNAKERFGVFVDTPGKVTFDIGYTEYDLLKISFEDLDTDVYVVDGDSMKDIVRSFREIIGASYIPPEWAFGFGQSRWGYKSADDIRAVEKGYKDAYIPLDMIYLDIDYMDGYRDFTINEETFPDFEAFVGKMKDKGIHLVPIIDAGVKKENGYSVCDEGIEKDYFCKDEDGNPLTAVVWPGPVHFPDFLKESTRKWFGDKYSKLVDMGIEGFWNDMNEPAIFYTDKGCRIADGMLSDVKEKGITLGNCDSFKEAAESLSDIGRDYRSFYHDVNGKKIRHDKVHNLYGYNMTRSAAEAFKRNYPDKRFLLFSRSSYIGMHRYGGVWTGDNASWWSHLALNIAQMPSLNMCGFLFCGSDLGGFNDDTTEDLMLRWIAFGIFTPLMRDHSALGTRNQELYRFKSKEVFADLIRLRYALLPYIYSEFVKAVENNDMYFKPLCFEYEDDRRAYEIEDELLVGESIMVAPICRQNTTGRNVYLPETMKMLRFRAYDDYDEEVLEAGDYYVRAGLNEVLVFIRPGKSLVIAKPGVSAEKTIKTPEIFKNIVF